MRMAHHVEQRGLLIQGLVAIAGEAIAAQALVRILDSPAWTPTTLRETLLQLTGVRARSGKVSEALKVAYLMVFRALVDPMELPDMSGIEGTLTSLPGRVILWIEKAKARANVNMYFARAIAAVDVSPPRRASREWQARLHAQLLPTMYEKLLRPAVSQAYEAYRRRQFRLGAAQLALALVLHKLDKGTYPGRLDELVPDYLDALPADPYARGGSFGFARVPILGVTYSGVGLKLRRDVDAEAAARGPKAWMLYSVAADGRDDGGALSWRGRDDVPGDWLVHLPGEPLPPQPESYGRDPAGWLVMGYDPKF